jgi:hypothetical protein
MRQSKGGNREAREAIKEKEARKANVLSLKIKIKKKIKMQKKTKEKKTKKIRTNEK